MPIMPNGEIYGKRPKQKKIPRNDFILANQPVELARHHLIPWTTVRRTWNYLIYRNEYDILQVWARLVLKRIYTMEWVDRRVILPMREHRFVDNIVLVRNLCWGAWNIFIGPRTRCDDPGAHFDRLNAGMFPKDQQFRLRQMTWLNYYFYHRHEILLKNRDEVIKLLREIPARRKFLQVDPNAWEPVLIRKKGIYSVTWQKKL